MVDTWGADMVRLMYLKKLTAKQLSREGVMSYQYISELLNGKKTSPKGRARLYAAILEHEPAINE